MAASKPESGSSSGFVDNWQAGKTLVECNLRMLEKEDSSDVTLRCGTNNHVIKAHRYMLISRSSVFHAMFSGPLAETSDVSVPEIEPGFFKELLVYMYTDNAAVDVDNATALLYAARKYAVSGLESKCIEFLETNLTVENACVILEASQQFDEKELFDKAMSLIKREGEMSLQSSGFLALSQLLVNQIVESDDLVAEEHVIFAAVNNWAESECDRQEREVTPESKRSVLGETLYKVRYPLMKQLFLIDDVKLSGLLTNEERLTILEYIIMPTGSIQPFNNNPRHSPRQQLIQLTSKHRFSFTRVNKSWPTSGDVDALSFASNKDLLILGCQLYNKYRGTGKTEYTVTTYFGTETNVLDTEIQAKTLYNEGGNVFDVLFSDPVAITAGEWYTLAVKMIGSETWRGEGGMVSVTCGDGVQFTFRNSGKSSSGTQVDRGQIPALIYSVS